MKKVLSAVLVSSVLFAGCASGKDTSSTKQSTSASVVKEEDPTKKSEGVMSYQEYVDTASDGTKDVTIETYVQAKQGWWEDNGQGLASIYTQDGDGGYFLYNMPMSEDDYKKLVEGQKIKVTGTKSEWSGEVEVTDGTFEIVDGNWVAESKDVTDLLDKDELIDYQNQKVAFKGLTVEAANEDSDEAFMYNWDGSGSQGDDLYFKVSDGENTYSFTVESYLCGKDTDVYKAVEALKVGDVIDCEGFLYWYEGANPHITSVTVK